MKPWFLMTFNIIISHVFPENFIDFPHVVQKIWKNSLLILAIFINFPQFFEFFEITLLQRNWWRQLITDDASIFQFQKFKSTVSQLYKFILILDMFFFKHERGPNWLPRKNYHQKAQSYYSQKLPYQKINDSMLLHFLGPITNDMFRTILISLLKLQDLSNALLYWS